MENRLASYALVITILLAAFGLSAGTARANEDYARRTGWDCGVCHINPLGGGELTAKGEDFKSGLVASGEFRPMSPVKTAVRLLVGYLHLLAGVAWLGTIFYVHILLKPAYASKGLPKGELVLGWTCISVIAVTGSLLTYSRMPSIEAFYTTRFGVLLSIKIVLYLIMVLTATLATFVIGPRMKRRREAALKEGGSYTPEDLHAFDGREGRKAFVSVGGVIYDLTGSRLWKEGRHMRHLAGDDLTVMLRQAPHGPEKLDGFPKAGTLDTTGSRPKNIPKAIFYVLAYINLVMVFLVLAVIALWRWL